MKKIAVFALMALLWAFEPPLAEASVPVSPEALHRLFSTARSFRYQADGRIDHWQSADETAQRRSGDCEDKSIWLASELERHGYKGVRVVVGRKHISDARLHAWVQWKDSSGRLWLLDPTAQRRPWDKQLFSDENYRALYSVTHSDRRKQPVS